MDSLGAVRYQKEEMLRGEADECRPAARIRGQNKSAAVEHTITQPTR
jgi:hypothetical protein